MLHAKNFSYIQIWYTHPFLYRVYVYMTNFEREAYNKRTTQYVLYFSFSFIQKKKQKSDTFFQNWKFQNLNYATIWNPGLFFFFLIYGSYGGGGKMGQKQDYIWQTIEKKSCKCSL